MTRILLAVVGTLMLAGTSARAHHGYSSFFDPQERTVAVEGQLERITYRNPHVIMMLRAPDSTLYTITWQGATWLERQASVTPSTFRIGDRLIVVGAPSRDPESREVTRIREVRRPSDQWLWRSDIRFAGPS